MKYFTNLDMEQNEIQNALLHPLSSAPENGVSGQVYYNIVDKIVYKYNGEKWEPINIKPDWNVPSGDNAEILNKPTRLGQFENDVGFITNTVDNLINYYKKTETYNKDEINNLINNVATVRIEVVETLPEIGKDNIIYFVPKEVQSKNNVYLSNTGYISGPTIKDDITGINYTIIIEDRILKLIESENLPGENNVYYEYVWINDRYELIGDTNIDLTNYLRIDGDGSRLTINGQKLVDILYGIDSGLSKYYKETVNFDGTNKIIQHNLGTKNLILTAINESGLNVWIEYSIRDLNSVLIQTGNIGSNIEISIVGSYF